MILHKLRPQKGLIDNLDSPKVIRARWNDSPVKLVQEEISPCSKGRRSVSIPGLRHWQSRKSPQRHRVHQISDRPPPHADHDDSPLGIEGHGSTKCRLERRRHFQRVSKRAPDRVRIALVGVQVQTTPPVRGHKGALRYSLCRKRIGNRRTAHKLSGRLPKIYLRNRYHGAAKIQKILIDLI